MMRIWPFLVAGLLLSLTSCAKTDRKAEEIDIIEATFRYQLPSKDSEQNINDPILVYFLEVHETPGKGRDPDDALMVRFAGNKPRVTKVSDSVRAADSSVHDKKTGEHGTILSVGNIKWISDNTVDVEGDWYVGNLGAGGGIFHLVKKEGKWIILKYVERWIS